MRVFFFHFLEAAYPRSLSFNMLNDTPFCAVIFAVSFFLSFAGAEPTVAKTVGFSYKPLVLLQYLHLPNLETFKFTDLFFAVSRLSDLAE
jgi:hypothetical protein